MILIKLAFYPCNPIQKMNFQLTEPLSITLMTRFLNHLHLLDTLNSTDSDSSNNVSVEVQKDHADAVLKNLLAVGKFLGERDDIKWVGSKKRNDKIKQEHENNSDSDNEEECDISELNSNLNSNSNSNSVSVSSAPPAFVVLMDKICKIGRKCRHVLPISTCLKFYAAILVTCDSVLSIHINDSSFESVFTAMLKLIDHVQTFSISRDQVRSKEWRSTLELSSVLLLRLKSFLGEDRHAVLNLCLVKSMSAARIARKEEKRRIVLMDPEKAAKMKSKDNQRKYKARKNNNSKKTRIQ